MLIEESNLRGIELVTAAVGLITALLEFVAKRREGAPTGRRTIILSAIVVLSLIIVSGIALYAWRSDRVLNASLESHDPFVFHNLTRKTYRVARFFPERGALQNEGNFADVLDGIKTLDVQSTSAHEIIRDYKAEIENALHQGAEMRFLLFDTSTKETCESLASSLNQGCEKLQKRLEESLKRLSDIYKDESRGKGRLDVKLYKAVPLKSFWIKNASTAGESVVQVEFHDREESQRASFRIGRLDDGAYLGSLERQFNATWDSSSAVNLSK
jgi:hypothetical protein